MGCRKSLPLVIPVQSVKEEPVVRKRRVTRKQLTISKDSTLSDNYELLGVQGSTNTGVLLTARHIATGTIRTILEVSKSLGVDHSEFIQEVSIVSELDHPNILKVIQSFETQRSYYIVLESADGGTIQSRIKKSGNEVLIGKYMQDIFSAINYMHIHGIIHCDLNIGNILLSNTSQDAIPKIVGFAFSQRINEPPDIDLNNLNYEYISPEMLEGKFDQLTDIWSAGVVVYQLLVGKLPFVQKNKKEILEAIIKGEIDVENPNFKALSVNAQEFIKKILVVDPSQRLTALAALSDPWLYQANKDVALSYEIVQKLRRFKVRDI